MRRSITCFVLFTIATLLLSCGPGGIAPAAADDVHVPNVAPTITSPTIYDDTHETNVHNAMINPASAGTVEQYEVTATIGDANTLNDILNVTVYVYDDNAVTAHGFTNGTYAEVGSYGFAWVNASGSDAWKELTAGGWSESLAQLDSSHSSHPTLTGSSGDWVVEFSMNKVSRRTATAAGWKVQVYVFDDNSAKASDNTLWFGINFYSETTVSPTVHWASVTLGGANQTADSNPYAYTVTANAPFKIQIKSLVAQLTGTKGQTPFDVSNLAIDDDGTVSEECNLSHLSTGWQDFDTNDLGSSKTNGSYWFITIPSVIRDDTYTFSFSSQVIINE